MEQKERTRDRSLGTRCSTVDRVKTPRQAAAHLQGVPTPSRMGTNPIFGLSSDHHSCIAPQGAPPPLHVELQPSTQGLALVHHSFIALLGAPTPLHIGCQPSSQELLLAHRSFMSSQGVPAPLHLNSNPLLRTSC